MISISSNVSNARARFEKILDCVTAGAPEGTDAATAADGGCDGGLLVDEENFGNRKLLSEKPSPSTDLVLAVDAARAGEAVGVAPVFAAAGRDAGAGGIGAAAGGGRDTDVPALAAAVAGRGGGGLRSCPVDG